MFILNPWSASVHTNPSLAHPLCSTGGTHTRNKLPSGGVSNILHINGYCEAMLGALVSSSSIASTDIAGIGV